MLRLRRALLASAAMGGGWGTITPPSGFTWTDYPVTIQQFGDSDQFRITEDVSDFAVTGSGVYYVDIATGDSGNAGTAIAPLDSVRTAMGKADVDVIYVKPGVYPRGKNWLTTIARSISVRPWPGESGEIYLTEHERGLAWALDGDNTYTSSRSGTLSVLDVSRTDANGDFEVLTNAADVAGCKATPGSWFLDSPTLYVHTTDERAPDADIWPIVVTANAAKAAANITLYLEGLTFVGGASALWFANSGAGQTPKLYAKDCTFAFAATGNGLRVQGVKEVVLQDCIAKCNPEDGFNYHAYNSVVPQVVEIDCEGRHNGLDGNDNGSTMHDAGSVVRVGGEYQNNNGPNVIDVGSSLSWNLGVYAHAPVAAAAGSRVNFWTDGNMWCERCVSVGGTYDYYAEAAGDTLYKRNCTGDASDGGTGTVTTY